MIDLIYEQVKISFKIILKLIHLESTHGTHRRKISEEWIDATAQTCMNLSV